MAQLTDREINILRHLADGDSLVDIANLYGFKKDTVKNWMMAIRDKTGMATTAAAVAWALRHKVID